MSAPHPYHPARRAWAAWPAPRSWPLGLSTCLLVACGGGGGGDAQTPANNAVSMTLGADSATLPWNRASALKVLANDTASRGALTLSAVGTPAHGSVRLLGNELEYTPSPGYVGADSFSYTVKAEDGSSASAQVSVKVQAAVSLQGVVSDGPIANAQVKAQVGTQLFSTTADAQGNYRLNISSDSASDLVQLVGIGEGAQARVKLQSLLGDLNSLARLADKDGVVGPAQSAATIVSHYSTALAALVREANGQQIPSKQADLTRLTRAVPAGRLLDIATAVKLVVDQGIALPDGVGDTLALAQGPTARLNSFLGGLPSASVSAVRAQVLSGQGLPAGAAFAPSQAVSWVSYSDQLGADAAQQFTLRPDGSADVLLAQHASAASWASSNGEISVQLSKPQGSRAYSASVDPVTGQQEELLFELLGFKLRQVAGGSDGGSALVSAHTRETVLSGSRKGQSSDQWNAAYLTSFADVTTLPAITNDFKPGDRFGGIDAFDGSGSDVMEITGTSSAKLLRSGTTLSWQLSNGRFIVRAGNEERSYAELGVGQDSDGFVSLLVTHSQNGSTTGIHQARVSALDGHVFQPDAALYTRWSSGFNVAGASQLFFEFASNGSGSTVTVDQQGESKQALSWSITADGQLRMLRNSGALIREWLLLNQRPGRLIVLESQRDARDNSLTIPWRLNIYSEVNAATPGTAQIGQLLSAKGEQYPLRVNFTIDAQGKITGGDFDFHGINGTMTPCTWSPQNNGSCFGTNGSISPKVQQGGPLKRGVGSATVISLVDGPNDYGYTFTGTLTGLDWVGTWTKVATALDGRTDSGSFAVTVGIR